MLTGNRPELKSCFLNLAMGGNYRQEKYFIGPSRADWLTAAFNEDCAMRLIEPRFVLGSPCVTMTCPPSSSAEPRKLVRKAAIRPSAPRRLSPALTAPWPPRLVPIGSVRPNR